MNIEKKILKLAKMKRGFTSADVINVTAFSPSYVHKVIQRLLDDGVLFKTGSTKSARYILTNAENIVRMKRAANKYSRVVLANGLEEHKVLEDLKKKTGFFNSQTNWEAIFDYAFTEILNNAIEHSATEKINIRAEKKSNIIQFEIRDFGKGIFSNIKDSLGLGTEAEAIDLLLKGKLTTASEGHTGEGIFFTSKAADTLIIQSSAKKLVFNNVLEDVFLRSSKPIAGTKVKFSINESSGRSITDIFNRFTNVEYGFDKTKINIRLFSGGAKYISRSEARRVLAGAEKFNRIELDFTGIESVGQGFADEVFRVWNNSHPGLEIIVLNANEDVMFMINRARAN